MIVHDCTPLRFLGGYPTSCTLYTELLRDHSEHKFRNSGHLVTLMLNLYQVLLCLISQLIHLLGLAVTQPILSYRMR